MGDQYWLDLEPTEAARLRAFLEPVGGCLDTSVCFSWPTASRLAVGFTVDEEAAEVALIACREIARRFSVKRLGAESVGWYEDSDWKEPSDDPRHPLVVYGDYESWVMWLADYRAAFSYRVRRGDDEYDEAWWAEQEAIVMEQFARLDAGTGG